MWCAYPAKHDRDILVPHGVKSWLDCLWDQLGLVTEKLASHQVVHYSCCSQTRHDSAERNVEQQ